MPATKIELLTQLKDQMVEFFDELIGAYPKESDFVIFRILIKDQLPTKDIMDYIVNELIPLKDLIVSRNDQFFLENNILFSKLNSTKSKKVNYFRQLWLTMNNDDKEAVWRWFQSFLVIAINYTNL